MINMAPVEETVVEAEVVETVASDGEIGLDMELGPLATALADEINNLEAILIDINSLEDPNRKGKAKFKADGVAIRKALRPVPDSIMQVWRDVHTFVQDTVETMPSERKTKSKESILAEIAELEARAAQM